MEAKPWPDKLQQSVQQGMDNGNGRPPLDGGDDSPGRCHLRLQQDVQSVVSEKGRQKIQAILDQVHTLVPIEKLLLYLRLPTETAGADPLRQSLNPLGSRSEISQTITWIQTHLEEDKELSLQKKGVYDDYVDYCERNSIKPLSTADFGKVMKQVYPNVRPRRLGTRGQSKYCYSGLRNRIKLQLPSLPDLSDKIMSTEARCTQSELMTAAWIVVKEWAESKLSVQFTTIASLAYFLVKEYSVGVGSDAANLVASAANAHGNDDPLASFGYLSRHRETTLQLQRKLQQKSEIIKETKRKQQSPRMESKSRGGKRMRPPTQPNSCTTSPVSTAPSVDSKCSPQSQEHSPVCDSINLQALPDFNRFQQQQPNTAAAVAVDPLLKDGGVLSQAVITDYPTGKVAISRITSTKQSAPASSPKRAKQTKYKALQPKLEPCDKPSYNPGKPYAQSAAARDPRSHQEPNRRQHQQQRKKDSPTLITPEESRALFSRERLISIGQVSKNALDEYLGTSNSQEHEEEIMQYFGNNNDNEQEDTRKLSQLRQLLERNQFVHNEPPPMKTSLKPTHRGAVPPNLQSLSARRRVSFETEAAPASRFIPISPLSPNGRQSKCSSTNASPFVSPRNTPVPRSRLGPFPPRAKARPARRTDLEIVIPENVDEFKPQMPMSAPPSPKTNYMYNKAYLNMMQPQHTVAFGDPLSPEVGQLLTPPNTLESAFRSQSVPLNAAVPNQFFGQFHFDPEPPQPPPPQAPPVVNNDFNDIDFNNDVVNVNKIIGDIDMLAADFDMPKVEQQMMDSIMKLPSKSVPSTPVPYTGGNVDVDPFERAAKSYPSTPLAPGGSFTYNPGQDYLLNGQPVKDKIVDYIYEDDNKPDYGGGGYEFAAAKQPTVVLNESAVVDDFFKVVPE